MADAYVVAVEGLASLSTLDEIPAEIERAALRAVNKTIERARATAAREMRQQVNFPARYLSGTEGRLSITKKARRGDLEGVVTGRHRPTSLARFSRGGQSRRGGVTVQVKPGHAVRLPRAFFVKLRAGTGTDTRNNLGLAIRLPEGQRPSAAYKPKQMGPNLWLLYGPSVDQVFDDVAQDISPDMTDYLEAEFLRLMELK